MARLRGDPRDRDIKVIGHETDARRMFDVWVMETPKLRPERTKLIKRLTKQCERRYEDALSLMCDLASGEPDQRLRNGEQPGHPA